MFVGSGSVNLKSALAAETVRCTVSLSGTTPFFRELPTLSEQPAEQCRTRSGTGADDARHPLAPVN
ncbi:hypothetical protein GCM10028832_45670 [Streptomyces sparsus]